MCFRIKGAVVKQLATPDTTISAYLSEAATFF